MHLCHSFFHIQDTDGVCFLSTAPQSHKKIRNSSYGFSGTTRGAKPDMTTSTFRGESVLITGTISFR